MPFDTEFVEYLLGVFVVFTRPHLELTTREATGFLLLYGAFPLDEPGDGGCPRYQPGTVSARPLRRRSVAGERETTRSSRRAVPARPRP